ncbi:MAG: OmpA family protein, partial [Myxococcota bacterium]|nr:OmpA family protein [Myxococcota bacterium]
AEARANLAFAVYESGQGRPMKASEHVELSEAAAKAAWQGSRGDECQPDTDMDGIHDGIDKCITEPEDYDGDRDEDGCPEDDRDGDGINDDIDRCPDKPEDFDGYMDEDGCPELDNDNDGIRDDLDRCPLDPEDRDGWEDIDGCPEPDNDGDGIMDPVDKCPNLAEDFDGDMDEDGCPDLYEKIVITETRIELKQKIFFATNSARILRKSNELLDEVVDALAKNGKLRVRIEGHTDSQANARYNKGLSQRRAQSVKKYIVKQGILGDRLTAVGFGEENPIDTNDTDEGRARNRRVEFHILK